MFDIVTIGGALVDIFIKSRDFSLQSVDQGVMLCQRYGDKIDVDSLELFLGGGGANTSVGFARAGFYVATLAETGQDAFTNFVIDQLKENKVDTQLLIRERKEQTGGSVILVGEDGGRTVLVHRGAAAQLDPSDLSTETIDQAGWIHLSSIAGRADTLLRIAQLRTIPQSMSWNPGKAELQLLATRQIRITSFPLKVFFCNQEEWMILADIQEEVLAHVPIVVITKGKQGGVVYQPKQPSIDFQPLPVTKVVDETGAGDAFCVGFVSGLLWGLDLEKSLTCAKRNSASVIQKMGAQSGLLSRSALISND